MKKIQKNSQDELNILSKIKVNPQSSQRKLANDLGLSLGKLNYCLKALQQKGLIKIENFSKQKNKVKYVVPWAQIIHTVDNIDLAQAISNRAPANIGVLIQVNTGQDTNKGGVLPTDALALAKEMDRIDMLTVRGFMTLPPMTEDPEDCAPYFAEVNDLAKRGRADGLQTDILSMGMSRDYRVAIREGSTVVRIGTAIFGARE